MRLLTLMIPAVLATVFSTAVSAKEPAVISEMAQTEMMRISYGHHSKVYKDKSKERIDKYILHTDSKELKTDY